MIVFKTYFKIVKSFLPTIILYTIIFTFFAVMSSISNVNQTNDFTAIKPNVAIINNDKDSKLINYFIEYVGEKSNIIDIANDEEKINDALFFRKADFILIIPKKFTDDFFKNLKPEIKTMQVPDSYAYTYLSLAFNKFFTFANVYVDSKMNEDLIIENLEKDLKESVLVEIPETEKNSKLEQAQYYYNFSNYTLIAICVHIVAMIMNSFRNIRIKRRNIISSTSYRKITNNLFLSNICIMFSIWIIYVVISLFLYGMVMLETRGILMIVNSLIFMITILSIGFLIGNMVNNRNAIDGIVNVLALGSSFICGAFVPQQYLGTFVLSIARLFPSYWFIKNNEEIVKLSIFNFENLSVIVINMLIVLSFGILIFTLTNLFIKYKMKEK